MSPRRRQFAHLGRPCEHRTFRVRLSFSSTSCHVARLCHPPSETADAGRWVGVLVRHVCLLLSRLHEAWSPRLGPLHIRFGFNAPAGPLTTGDRPHMSGAGRNMSEVGRVRDTVHLPCVNWTKGTESTPSSAPHRSVFRVSCDRSCAASFPCLWRGSGRVRDCERPCGRRGDCVCGMLTDRVPPPRGGTSLDRRPHTFGVYARAQRKGNLLRRIRRPRPRHFALVICVWSRLRSSRGISVGTAWGQPKGILETGEHSTTHLIAVVYATAAQVRSTCDASFAP